MIGEYLKTAGRYTQTGGLICLAIAAAIGAAAIDLVILIGALQGKIDKYTFFTYMIFSYLLSRHDHGCHSDHETSPWVLLILSVVTTIIGIIIALELGMPVVALGLVIAWTIPLVVLGIGAGLEALGNYLGSVCVQSTTESTGLILQYNATSGSTIPPVDGVVLQTTNNNNAAPYGQAHYEPACRRDHDTTRCGPTI